MELIEPTYICIPFREFLLFYKQLGVTYIGKKSEKKCFKNICQQKMMYW